MTLRNLWIFGLSPLCLAFALQSVGEVGVQDSIAYWGAVQAFMRGENPYDLATLLNIQRSIIPHIQSPQLFLNPPWAIPLLLPLFCWSFATSSFLLLAANISLTFFTLRKLSELMAPLSPRYTLLVGAFFPIVSCWYFGQLSCFILLGAILSLQWVVQKYRPWWKVGVALLLFSIKPQTMIILSAALVATTVRCLSLRDISKVLSIALAPVVFLAYRGDFLGWWFSSFTYSTRYVTSSLPSLTSSALSSVNELAFLLLPAALVGACVLTLEKGGISPYRFLVYMLISSLMAPYAWIFDFSPFLIITYAAMVVAVQQPGYSVRRWGSVSLLIALCLPFESLFTNNLQAYALHPLLVVILLVWNHRDIPKLFERMKLNGDQRALDRSLQQQSGSPDEESRPCPSGS